MWSGKPSPSSPDQRLIWHPFTQEKTAPPPLWIDRGEGAYLYDRSGKAYLDLISSWWVNLHGHAHPEIADAIHAQARQLEHVIFAGFTHEPAVTLCERLNEHTHPAFSKYFFSDNGSTAVEVALKMAYQFWWNQNQPQRQLFVAFEGGYHGDTFGAMSIGKSSAFHRPFQDFFFQTHLLPFPETWEGDDTVAQREATILAQFQALLHETKDQLAGIIVEPLIQGAGGMRCCRPTFLNQLMAMAQEHGVLVLFDEVMTGFGRTGTLFAYEQLEHVPDILCVSKGITGGFLPLALTVTSERIYGAFQGDTFDKALAHGHSYTANPLGCAAAIASLEVFQQPQTQAQWQGLVAAQKKAAKRFYQAGLDRIQRVRNVGTLVAFDWQTQGDDAKALTTLKARGLEAGFLIRPLGNTVYILPPYCTPLDALDAVYDWLLDQAV